MPLIVHVVIEGMRLRVGIRPGLGLMHRRVRSLGVLSTILGIMVSRMMAGRVRLMAAGRGIVIALVGVIRELIVPLLLMGSVLLRGRMLSGRPR
jgi:hypothetical protein